ncbi:MAG: hypothetical protein ACREEG_12590, partial [Phenylobacterium sp.]
AARLFPLAAARGLVRRLEAGLDVPYGAEAWLRGSGLRSDSAALQGFLLGPSDRTARARDVAAAAIAGPETVGRLLDAYLQRHAELEAAPRPVPKTLLDAYAALQTRLEATDASVFGAAILGLTPNRASAMGALAQLIRQQGGRDDNSRVSFPADLQRPMAARLEAWGEALLADAGATRSQLQQLVGGLARVGAPSSLRLILRILDADHARLQAARDRQLANGRATAGDDLTGYDITFARAFEGIGGEAVATAMLARLADPGFGDNAAFVLRTLRDRKAGFKRSFREPEAGFSTLRARATAGRSRPTTEEPYARAMFDTAGQLLADAPSADEVRLAFRLATIAYSFADRGDSDLAARLMATPAHRFEKAALISTMLSRGYAVATDQILAGLELLYQDAKTHSWLLTDGRGVREWLDLLPYTERPEAIFPVIAQLEEHDRTPWALQQLTTALGQTPTPGAERILARLLADDPRFAEDHHWQTALLAIGDVNALTVLLDGLAAIPAAKGDGSRWTIPRAIAGLMTRDESVRAAVYDRLGRDLHPTVRDILAQAVAEAPTPAGLRTLIEVYAVRAWPYGGPLSEAVRKLAIGETPSEEFPGSHELVGRPLADVRRELFAMTADAVPTRADLAAAVLTAIDELRDEYGPAAGEPRHPDLASGRAWPLDARS